MDYVEWCDHILSTLVEKANTDLTVRSFCIYTEQIRPLFKEHNFLALAEAAFQASLHFALMDFFEAIGLLESERQRVRVWKIRKNARDYLLNKVGNWEANCNTFVEDEQAELLEAVHKIGIEKYDNWVSLRFVSTPELQNELNWKKGFSKLNVVATELDQEGFLKLHGWLGGFELRPTFLGQVWITRRGFTLESRQIDNLVAE